jgi:hypothetical protein
MAMNRHIAPWLLFVTLLGTGCGARTTLEAAAAPPAATAPSARAERVVFVARGLSDEDLVALTANAAACNPHAVILLDTPTARPYVQAFLAEYKPDRLVPVGAFADDEVRELQDRFGATVAHGMHGQRGQGAALWQELFMHAERVVVCPAQARRLMLQAACLAGNLRAPFVLVRGADSEKDLLRRQLAAWRTKEVLAIGDAGQRVPADNNLRVTHLADEAAVARASLQHQLSAGAVTALVIANPDDTRDELGRMSALAPWIRQQ